MLFEKIWLVTIFAYFCLFLLTFSVMFVLNCLFGRNPAVNSISKGTVTQQFLSMCFCRSNPFRPLNRRLKKLDFYFKNVNSNSLTNNQTTINNKLLQQTIETKSQLNETNGNIPIHEKRERKEKRYYPVIYNNNNNE